MSFTFVLRAESSSQRRNGKAVAYIGTDAAYSSLSISIPIL